MSHPRSRQPDQAVDADEAGTLLELTDCAPTSGRRVGWCARSTASTLSLERGQALGIVGESGSGKTMLSRSIMGLLTDAEAVRRGSVRFEGRRSSTAAIKQMRAIWGREMAMIFQDPMTLAQPADARSATRSPSRCACTSA